MSTNTTDSTKENKRSQSRSILRQYYEISSRRYAGDYGACDVLIDLQTAISRARLTRRQSEALTLIYGDGLTQAEAAGLMGVKQHTLSEVLANGERRIDAVYDRWAEKDEKERFIWRK